MRNRSLPTLLVPCSTFVATNNTLCTWHDECNMSFWWCCVPVILFVDGQQKVRGNKIEIYEYEHHILLLILIYLNLLKKVFLTTIHVP